MERKFSRDRNLVINALHFMYTDGQEWILSKSRYKRSEEYRILMGSILEGFGLRDVTSKQVLLITHPGHIMISFFIHCTICPATGP